MWPPPCRVMTPCGEPGGGTVYRKRCIGARHAINTGQFCRGGSTSVPDYCRKSLPSPRHRYQEPQLCGVPEASKIRSVSEFSDEQLHPSMAKPCVKSEKCGPAVGLSQVPKAKKTSTSFVCLVLLLCDRVCPEILMHIPEHD